MKQIFVQTVLVPDVTIELDEKTAHHLFNVLRTTSKERIRIVDINQNVFYGHLLEKPFLQVDEASDEKRQEYPNLTLCAALIKADKFEWMLQKAAELGVSRIVPFTCKNTVVDIDARKIGRKLERWQSILDGACRQSNRTSLCTIEKPVRFCELKNYKSSLNICAWEKESGSHHLCCELPRLQDSATFVIGPEGGLSPQEAESLEQEGFLLCSLGSRILRAETAACYMLAAADYAWNARQDACSPQKKTEADSQTT